MDTMKKFVKYAIWIVIFWIFSDILIQVGLNSTYKDMEKIGIIPDGIQVIQMQSTKVNGRIKLELNGEWLDRKYIKIDLYSESGNKLGTQYIEIGEMKENQIKNIDTYFKMSDVKAYEISVVEERGETTVGFMDTALTTMTVVILVLKILFV